MSQSGSIVEYEGKRLFVFGIAEIPGVLSEYPVTFYTGINLDTGKVDDIRSRYVDTVPFHELTEHQQVNVSRYVRVYHKLKKNVVAISAKARSGKDELARYLCQNYHNVGVIALGDAIKDVRKLLFGETEKKDRHQLIMIGQGLRREDPNIWNKVWLTRAIKAMLDNALEKVVCTDVRQPSEHTFFKSLGALSIKIEADEEARLNVIRLLDGDDALDEKLLNDETEMNVENFETDIILFNDYGKGFYDAIQTEVLPVLSKRGW